MSSTESDGGEQPRAPRSAFSFGGEQLGAFGPGSSAGSGRPRAQAGRRATAGSTAAGRPRRGRRQATLLAGLAVVAAAGCAVLFTGVLGGGSSRPSVPAPTAATPLSRAAYVTDQSAGFQFHMSVEASLAGHSFSIGGEGAIDERTHEGTVTMTVAGQRLTELIKKPYLYVQLPAAASALAGGKAWVRANLVTYSQSLGVPNPFEQGSSSPTEMLRLLSAGGQVSTVGQEDVEGVQTTHYHAVVDLQRYAAQYPGALRGVAERQVHELARLTGGNSLPVDVWLDGQGRVRRFSMSMGMCTRAGTLTERVELNLYGYGPQPAVTPPPASEVSEFTGRLPSQSSRALQQLGC